MKRNNISKVVFLLVLLLLILSCNFAHDETNIKYAYMTDDPDSTKARDIFGVNENMYCVIVSRWFLGQSKITTKWIALEGELKPGVFTEQEIPENKTRLVLNTPQRLPVGKYEVIIYEYGLERYVVNFTVQKNKPALPTETVLAPTNTVIPTETKPSEAKVDPQAPLDFYGPYCEEAEGTFIYKWSVELLRDSVTGAYAGTIKFHNCPEGGRVLYQVTDQAQPGPLILLTGVKQVLAGGGTLNEASPDEQAFEVDLNSGQVTPNFVP